MKLAQGGPPPCSVMYADVGSPLPDTLHVDAKHVATCQEN